MEEEAATGLFEESPGNTSYMRVASGCCLAMSFVTGLITLLKPGVESSTGLYLTGCFLICAFFPKAVQKFAEAKFPK